MPRRAAVRKPPDARGVRETPRQTFPARPADLVPDLRTVQRDATSVDVNVIERGASGGMHYQRDYDEEEELAR